MMKLDEISKAICEDCGLPMTPGNGCKCEIILVHGNPYRRIPYGSEGRPWPRRPREPCHDCNVKAGQYHHIGCDVEHCPRCGGQLISCDCIDPEEEYRTYEL